MDILEIYYIILLAMWSFIFLLKAYHFRDKLVNEILPTIEEASGRSKPSFARKK